MAEKKSGGQNTAEQFQIPPAQAEAIDDLIAQEQWLQRVGIREVMLGVMSADAHDIRRGCQKLRVEFETHYRDGYAAGRQAARWCWLCALVAITGWFATLVMVAWRGLGR